MSIRVDVDTLICAELATEAIVLENIPLLRCNAFDDYGVLLRGMHMFPYSVAVQTETMRALDDTVFFGCEEDGEDGDDGNIKALRRAVLFDSNALATIVSAMRVHPGDTTVTSSSFGLICTLLLDPVDVERAASAADAAGVFDSVLNAMAANPVDVGLHTQGLRLVSCYASRSAAAAAALRRVVDPNRAYPRIDADASQCCWLVERDPADTPAFRVFANGDLLRLVLRRLPAEEASVRLAADVLSGVSRGLRAAVRELVVDQEWLAPLLRCAAGFVMDVAVRPRENADTSQQMLRGMREYRSRASVQIAALDELNDLVVFGYPMAHPGDCIDTKKLVRRGLLGDCCALVCVVSTMRMHQNNGDVIERCFALLAWLLDRSFDGGPTDYSESTDYNDIVGRADDAGVCAEMMRNMLANPGESTLWVQGHGVMYRLAAGSAVAAATAQQAEAVAPQLRQRHAVYED